MKIRLKVCNKGWTEPGDFNEDLGHPCWEIVYMMKGKCNFRIQKDGKEFTLNEGEAVIVRPGVHHSSGPVGNNRYLCFWLLVDFPAWRIVPKNVKGMRVIIRDRLFFEILFNKLLEYGTLSSPERIKESVLTTVLLFLKTETHRNNSGKKMSGRIHSRIAGTYQNILRIIEENYQRKLSLSEIAGRVNLSRSRVSHLFKEVAGMSFGKYLLYYRINAAKDFLVTHKDEPVKKIAYISGFRTLNHFYLRFRRIAGMSPIRYRKINS